MALLEKLIKELEIDLTQVESNISHVYSAECYVGENLSPMALFTNEIDSQNIGEALEFNPGDRVLDIGCGIGVFLISNALKHPDVQFFGVEIVKERIEVANKLIKHLNLQNVIIQELDLGQVPLPRADHYFLYFSTGRVYSKILNQLLIESTARSFKIAAIESHGDLLYDLEQRPWLQIYREIELSAERHFPLAKIYSTVKSNYHSELKKSIALLERQLLIEGQVDWNNRDRHHWEYAMSKDHWFFKSIHRDPKIEFYPCSSVNFSSSNTISTPHTAGDISLNKIIAVTLSQN